MCATNVFMGTNRSGALLLTAIEYSSTYSTRSRESKTAGRMRNTDCYRTLNTEK